MGNRRLIVTNDWADPLHFAAKYQCELTGENMGTCPSHSYRYCATVSLWDTMSVCCQHSGRQYK